MMRLRWLAVLCVVAIAAPGAQQPSIDDFFRTISDGWVRLNPNLAVATRYFSGDEQDRLEQQISSYIDAAERERLAYIQRGLQDLGRFDRSSLSDAQRLSADVLRYHLQLVRRFGEIRRLRLPPRSVRRREHMAPEHAHRAAPHADGEGCVALCRPAWPGRTAHGRGRRRALRQRAEKDLTLPRFILNLTIDQMRRFVETPPAQNPFVTSLDERAAAIKALAPEARAALVGQAERIVRERRIPRMEQSHRLSWKRSCHGRRIARACGAWKEALRCTRIF